MSHASSVSREEYNAYNACQGLPPHSTALVTSTQWVRPTHWKTIRQPTLRITHTCLSTGQSRRTHLDSNTSQSCSTAHH
jgi:hypothetical protein